MWRFQDFTGIRQNYPRNPDGSRRQQRVRKTSRGGGHSCGHRRPGDTRPNLVIVKVGAGGQVSFYNNVGSVDLIVDIAGYFGATGSSLTSTSPNRLWDSRVGPGPIGRIGPGGTRTVTFTNVGGISAVVLNVTAQNPSADTFVTAWPTGEPRPLTSNLNIPPGDTRPNLVIVKVGAGGQVSFYNNAGTVDLIVDLAGWYGVPGA